MNKYKIFDFDFALSQTHNHAKINWLKSNCNTIVTEKKFVEMWSSNPRFGKNPSKKYSPSASRSQYRRLKKIFGFFM